MAEPKRVLIVDDDPSIQRLLTRVLERVGIAPTAADTAAAADRALAAGSYDLVLLDLFLPDEDGRRLLVRWRSDSPARHVPIFVLSATLGNAVKTECFSLGADAYFEKPVDPMMVVAAVRSRLERPASATPVGSPLAAPAPAPGLPANGAPAGPRSASSAQPTEPRSGVSNAAEPSPGARRVLVAEDDPSVAAIIKHRLSRSGFQVHHHDNGTAAFRDTDAWQPDLAVLDIKLPGMDGLELLSRLRGRDHTKTIPVIMLTASAAEGDMVRAFALGADDYLMKPFSPTELLARVERLERRARG